jgi:uncharacterized membrane protein
LKNLATLLIAAAFTLGGSASASADTILLASYGTSASNPGVGNSATTYDNLTSTVNSGSSATTNIGSGDVWHVALGTSSYVSFDAATSPDGNLTVPSGDYIYSTTFNLSAAQAGGIATLSVLADDTVSVYLNNVLVLQAAGAMNSSNEYTKCSDVGPGCVTPLTFSFSGLQTGLNELTFDVKQVNGSNEGLDFSGFISDTTPVPEPTALVLFGTGLFGLVGASRRYFALK